MRRTFRGAENARHFAAGGESALAWDVPGCLRLREIVRRVPKEVLWLPKKPPTHAKSAVPEARNAPHRRGHQNDAENPGWI